MCKKQIGSVGGTKMVIEIKRMTRIKWMVKRITRKVEEEDRTKGECDDEGL